MKSFISALAPTAPQSITNYWPWLLVPLSSMLLLAPTWLRLFEQWLRWDEVLMHGLPTFLIFLVITVLHPPLMPKPMHKPRYSPLAGFALILTVLLWSLLTLANIDLLTALLVPVIMANLAWLLFGATAMWRFMPYLVLFTLSLPFWGDLVPLLIWLASQVVGRFVGQLGMTALIEGSSITLPWGRLLIVDGCSGISFLAVGSLLGALIALLNDYRWRGWLICLGIAAALAVVVNWIRITGLVIIGYQTQMQSPLMESHDLYGWLIFAAVALPVLYFAPIHRRPVNKAGLPVLRHQKIILFLMLAVLAGPVVLWTANRSFSTGPYWVIEQFEPAPAGGQGQPLPLNLPDGLVQNHYRLTDPPIWVHTAQFQRQSTEDKLVPYLGNPVDTNRWQRRGQIGSSDGAFPVMLYHDVISQRRVAQLQWFRVGGLDTTDYRLAKLQQIPSMLRNENHFALITLQLICRTLDCQQEGQALQALAEQLKTELPR